MTRSPDGPPDLTLDQVVERLGVAGATDGERRRAIADLAYGGRIRLPWLKVLRQAGYLPHDVTRDG